MAEQGITEPKGVISQSLGDLEIGQNYFLFLHQRLELGGQGLGLGLVRLPVVLNKLNENVLTGCVVREEAVSDQVRVASYTISSGCYDTIWKTSHPYKKCTFSMWVKTKISLLEQTSPHATKNRLGSAHVTYLSSNSPK